MCLAIPGRIVAIEDNLATVDINGVVTRADITLLENLSVGDFVLVHAGFAIQKYDREDAEETLRIFRELGNID
jgi:hydrogenase expression/formation protein HypC